VKAPPPQYHLEEASRLVEPPAMAPALAAEAKANVRCPKCKRTFQWEQRRPVQVECPHCGVKGLLR
jgi:DNA-directed RNA polymerase subunit RPC12/RpoP